MDLEKPCAADGDFSSGWRDAPTTDTSSYYPDGYGWLVERNGVVVRYDADGYPDFSPYRDYEVHVSDS